MKTTMKRLALALTFALLLAGLLTVVPAQAAVNTSKVVLSGLKEVNLGETLALTATVTPVKSTQKVTWATSDKKIATVSGSTLVDVKDEETGAVTARTYQTTVTPKKAGTVTITATSGKKKATVKIKVIDPKKATSVALDIPEYKLQPGETFTLTPSVEPATAVEPTTYAWASSNKKIATVAVAEGAVQGRSAVVTALYEGTATITVKTDSGKTAACKVTVEYANHPENITLDQTGTVPLPFGAKLDLGTGLTMLPEGSNSSVAWASSNTKVATVSAAGVVTANKKKAGTVTVTAKTYSGAKTTVRVAVYDPKKSSKVALDKSGTVTLNLGDTLVLTGKVTPANSPQKVTWATSNKKIATVSGSGVLDVTNEATGDTARTYQGTVTPKKEGTVTITATCGAKKATVKVKVVDPRKATKVTLDKTEYTLQPGESFTLTPTAYPDTAADYTTYTWSTSNKKIAAGQPGEGSATVNALFEGTATITVKTNTGKTATCKVTVVYNSRPDSIALDQTGTVQLPFGATLDLGAGVTMLPEGSNSSLTWTSSATKYAKVSAAGVVTADKKNVGTTTITVKTSNGKKATVKVAVYDPTKATKVTLDQSGTVTLPLNQKLTLTATRYPETATSKLTWSTSDKKIATVSSSGVVAPKKNGTATITVKTSTGKKASVKVKVVAPVYETTAIIGSWPDSEEDNTTQMGEDFNASAWLEPDGAKSVVTWTSSDESVARIKSSEINGVWCEVVIEPVGPGKAVITATTDNGLSDSFTLTVIGRVVPESIVFVDVTGPLTAELGKTLQFDYDVLPGESIFAPENCATVTSSNPEVATVSGASDNAYQDCRGAMNFTLTVTPKAPGTTTITVTLGNGVSNSIVVNVPGAEEPAPADPAGETETSEAPALAVEAANEPAAEEAPAAEPEPAEEPEPVAEAEPAAEAEPVIEAPAAPAAEVPAQSEEAPAESTEE